MQNEKLMSTGYDVVRKTQIALFKESDVDKRDFEGLIHLFSPDVLAEYLGLNYCEVEEIPTNDPKIEVAGVLDRRNKIIHVSKKFPAEQRRLTGMHEIVHWMLHKHVGLDVLHRDRPISYLPEKTAVEWFEWEATNVGCQYLMPEKLVKDKFSEIFNLPYGEPLVFDESVAFYLKEDIEALRKMKQMQKVLRLVTASFYGDIIPLHQLFKVSPTAMAIRLLELNLIAQDRQRGVPDLYVVR